jgi:hypothetical protein
MNRILNLAVIIGSAAFIAGCGSNSGTPPSSPPVVVRMPSVKPLPLEYRVLAEHLALEMKTSPNQFRDDKGMPEIISELHSAVIGLRAIQSSDTDITYIATLGQDGLSDAVSRLERINSMPKPPSDGEMLVSSFFAGMLTGDPVSGALAGGAIGNDADQKRNAVASEVLGLFAAVDKADAAHMMLPKIAEKYAATPSSAAGRIVIDIDESWGGFGPNDWLSINNSGPALEDCTIQVQLTGSTGQVRKNVHFVRQWPTNTWMYARYEPGQEILHLVATIHHNIELRLPR